MHGRDGRNIKHTEQSQLLVLSFAGVKKIRSSRDAQGGVLFIDEAYSLVDGYKSGYGEETLQRYFDIISETKEFEEWYFAHWHMDEDIGNYHCLWNSIIELE